VIIIEGHNFGVVSMLVEAGKRIRSIPVTAEFHESTAQTNRECIVKKMVRMMRNIDKMAGEGTIGVCDTLFFQQNHSGTAALFFDKNGKPLLYIASSNLKCEFSL
jgi:hypothetical protein